MTEHIAQEAGNHITSLYNLLKEQKEALLHVTAQIVDGSATDVSFKRILSLISRNPCDMQTLNGDVEKRKKAIRALIIELGT
jgi:hypothetical protein